MNEPAENKTEPVKDDQPRPKPPRMHDNSVMSQLVDGIMEYRDSALFQWISKHQTLAMIILGLGGFLIILFYIVFLIMLTRS